MGQGGSLATLSLALVALVALSSAVAIALFSKLWLTHYSRGPLEQLVAWWCREE